MASVRETLDLLAARLHEERLQAWGFRLRGHRLWRRHGENWGLLYVESTTHSTPEYLRIRASLGVESSWLRKCFRGGSGRRSSPPRPSECHWWDPIGHSMPVGYDFWWDLPSPDASGVENDFRRSVYEFGVPALEEHCEDDFLKELWKKGTFGVTDDIERLKYAALLAAKTSDEGSIRFALDELRTFAASEYRWAWRAGHMIDELRLRLTDLGIALPAGY